MLSKIKKESQQSYLDYLSAFLFFNTLFTGVLTGLAYLGMPWIMDLLLAKADVAVRTEAIYLSRWLLLSPLLFSLANTLSSFLMSNKHYFLILWALFCIMWGSLFLLLCLQILLG